MNSTEADDETDDNDGDEDEDQEEYNHEDAVMDIGDLLDVNWQEALPASAAATQRQISSIHTPDLSSSSLLPAPSDTHNLSNLSAAVEQWNEEAHGSTTLSSPFSFSFVQSNDPNAYSSTRVSTQRLT